MQTLYASFADRAQAEQAAGALLDHGLRNEDLSLVSHQEDSGRVSVPPPFQNLTARDVADYGVRGGERSGDSTYLSTGGVGPRIVEIDDRAPAGTSALLNAETGPGYSSAQELNEAAVGAGLEPAPDVLDAGTTPEDLGVEGVPDKDVDREGNREAEDLSAKTGLSVTTPQDAEAGAVKGAGIGLGVGALAALASLFVPGVGLILGGGALATAVGGAALATGAGAIAGGVEGYLKDQGVPEREAHDYAGTVAGGGSVIAVRLPEGGVSEQEIRAILDKYGARDVHASAPAQAT